MPAKIAEAAQSGDGSDENVVQRRQPPAERTPWPAAPQTYRDPLIQKSAYSGGEAKISLELVGYLLAIIFGVLVVLRLVAGGVPTLSDIWDFIFGKEPDVVWTSVPPMQTGRSLLAAATYNGALYALGGVHHDGHGRRALSSVESFNGSSWRDEADLLEAREAPAAVAFQDRLYVIGGYGARGYARTVESFDGTAWRSEPPMRAARYGVAAAVFQDRLYAAGGFDGAYVRAVESFDGSTWRAEPEMGTARRQLGLATFAGRLYALGGYGPTVESFDGVRWREEADMLIDHGVGTAAAVYDGRLFTFGGYYTASFNATAASSGGVAWRFEQTLPDKIRRYYLAVAAFQGRLFALGGEDQFAHILATAIALEAA